MKCLWHYEWVKLPRNIVPEGKGVLGDWARLASRAAFRKGTSLYCGYTNTVIPGMWAGGVVGLKSTFTDVGNWDEYGEYVNQILSGSLYQTEMGKKIRTEIEKETPEEFFQKYQFLTLSTCRSWVGRNARLLVISVRQSMGNI